LTVAYLKERRESCFWIRWGEIFWCHWWISWRNYRNSQL